MSLTSTSPAVVAFVAGIQKINDDAGCDRDYSINEGARYLKVVAKIRGLSPANGGSAYCFIDRATGDLLKTASWASPAKGARGNVNDANPFITASPYGFGYRR
jgi:hypothetical protein